MLDYISTTALIRPMLARRAVFVAAQRRVLVRSAPAFARSMQSVPQTDRVSRSIFHYR